MLWTVNLANPANTKSGAGFQPAMAVCCWASTPQISACPWASSRSWRRTAGAGAGIGRRALGYARREPCSWAAGSRRSEAAPLTVGHVEGRNGRGYIGEGPGGRRGGGTHTPTQYPRAVRLRPEFVVRWSSGRQCFTVPAERSGSRADGSFSYRRAFRCAAPERCGAFADELRVAAAAKAPSAD